MSNFCPICASPAEEREFPTGNSYYSCRRCGKFEITEEVFEDYIDGIRKDTDKIALVSYELRQMQRESDDQAPVIHSDLMKILLEKELPRPSEQIDNFIIWLGNNLPGIGETIELIPYEDHLPIIGAKTIDGFRLIVNYLKEEGLLSHDDRQRLGSHKVTLSIPGWEYFEQLNQGAKDSRRAFMAMKFGDSDLDKIITDHFKPAVKDTGFSLITLDDDPAAGLIDDRMRVEIRRSRFLIADLTHDNSGAYWESGFAEGLEKPVIYTCEKSKWAEKKSHFDTNHLLTIIWDKDNPAEAADKLKATIRATLPSEAKLSDD